MPRVVHLASALLGSHGLLLYHCIEWRAMLSFPSTRFCVGVDDRIYYGDSVMTVARISSVLSVYARIDEQSCRM